MVHFAAPALLAGLVAAALPPVIHLLLRPRPRRVRFPAVAFLRPALASGQRAQRLRNLWLLLVRALLLACVAILLAGPTCAPTAEMPEADMPVACALVMDDSWSMRYQLDDETTLLDRARAAALELTRAAADWPQSSALALVAADPRRPVTELTTDYTGVRARLREAASTTPHTHSLHHALREAAGLLQGARQPARRLVVFTDGAGHAWRDVTPGLLTGIDNLSVSVHSVAPERLSNIAITSASGPPGRHPENAPVPLSVTVNAAGLKATCFVEVRDGERVLERVGPLLVSADGARYLSLVLPAQPRGVHGLVLEVEPADRLVFDQRRHVVFQSTERPAAWLVTAADGDGGADLTALVLRNMLAPEALETQRQLVTFRQVGPAELGSATAEETEGAGRGRGERDVELIVIVGGVELNESARRSVRQAAERGATVLLVPGSGEDAADWPGFRRLLARAILRAEALDSVTSFSWEVDSPFSGRGEALDELTRTAVRRRVVLGGLEEGVVVEARYADGLPAIVSLRRGRGRLVLLTTSPDPQWSDLGVRAAGLLTWLHELLRDALGPPDAIATFTVGQATRHSFPALPSSGVARVFMGADEGGNATTVRVVNAEPARGWPTDSPGIYAVRTARKDVPELLYAVNPAPEESDLSRIAADRLEALLGVGQVRITGADSVVPEAAGTWLSRLTGLREGARMLPFVLLALVVGELALAGGVRRAGKVAGKMRSRNGHHADAGA